MSVCQPNVLTSARTADKREPGSGSKKINGDDYRALTVRSVCVVYILRSDDAQRVQSCVVGVTLKVPNMFDRVVNVGSNIFVIL